MNTPFKTIRSSFYPGLPGLLLLLAAPAALTLAQPNVVLIVSDDAGYADFGFMDELTGKTTVIPTPHLDRLSAQGTKFSSAYTGSVCSPSRAAITTGFYQNRLGYEYNTNNLTAPDARDGHFPETVTIFEWMRDLGYTTGAIGKWHIGATADDGSGPGNRPERQGVDHFFGIWGGSRQYQIGGVTRADQLLRRTDVAPDGTITGEVLENEAPWQGGDVTQAFGKAAENFIREQYDAKDESGNPKPFFLYVAFTAPHGPLYNSPDYNDPRIAGLPDGNRRQYASMMITMDKAFGGIVDQLEDPDGNGNSEDSILDETFIVFINDNGGPFSNASDNFPLRGQKGRPEEGGIRVPMFMTGSGVPSDSIYDEPIHSIDIVPTVAGLAGATPATTVDGVRISDLDGVDLLPFLSDSQDGSPHEAIVVRKDDRVGLRKGDWKLVAYDGLYELYNLAEDIGETNNLASTEPDILADLLHELTVFDAHSDKPRHASLDSPPDSINLNDGFVAVPPDLGGTVFVPDLTIIGATVLNGDFNAAGGTGTSTFAETDAWENIGTGDQSQVATNTSLPVDGTRNALIASTDARTFGLDTGYTLAGGELLQSTYQWRDAWQWTDAADRIAVTLYVTDDNALRGNRTVVETALSRLSAADNSYQTEAHTFAAIPAEFAGKRLFVQVDSATVGTGFARLDNFTLARGSIGEATESQFNWSESSRWKDADTGQDDALLVTDSFPGTMLSFPLQAFDYRATNNMTRMTRLEFMLNKLVFTGNEAGTATIDGLPLIFTDRLSGEAPAIEMNADSGTVRLQNDLVLFDNLLITGNGAGTLVVEAVLSDESDPRQITKAGYFTLRLESSPTTAGPIVVEEGTLALSPDVALSVNRLTLRAALRIEAREGATDPFEVTNLLELDGAVLDLTGFDASAIGDGLVIISYGVLEGEFASVSGLPADHHLDYAHAGGTAIAIVPNTPFDDWARVTSGLTGTPAAFEADPNGDGVSNGLAWYLGMEDAMSPAADALPRPDLQESPSTFRFNRRKDAPGLAARVLASHNLAEWSLLEDGVDGISLTITPHADSSQLEVVSIQFPHVADVRNFLRVEVSSENDDMRP